MLLPDHEIWARCHLGSYPGEEWLIEPFVEAQLAPCSYDVRLSNLIRIPHCRDYTAVDLRRPVTDRTEARDMNKTEGHLLMPGRFVLGATRERLNVPYDLAARVDGKSSLARIGLQIHSAGFIDPGFRGDVTLEIANLGEDPIVLWPDVLIAQIEFVKLTSVCAQPYTGHYQNSQGPVASRFNQALEPRAEVA